MKTMLAGLMIAAGLLTAVPALAAPAMCDGHADHADMPNGYGKGDRYVTACGGDSGPDAAGNNAIVPRVGWKQ